MGYRFQSIERILKWFSLYLYPYILHEICHHLVVKKIIANSNGCLEITLHLVDFSENKFEKNRK